MSRDQKIISLFNNKGGVGKPTFPFHVAHVLAEAADYPGRLAAGCNVAAQVANPTALVRRPVWLIVKVQR
jgi:hypothetical protein